MEKQIDQNSTTTQVNQEVASGDVQVVDAASERAYVRKMDCYLLPFLSLMYFFNSVDRSNLGNAKTDGIDVDLHFKGNQYSLLLLLFYIPNGLCDLPLNMLTKRFSGRIMLPALMLGWGTMALIQSASKNFGGLLALRLILAVFEAGFFAGAVFYLSLFYARGELGFRIAIFFGSALLASAFSGLISYGVFQWLLLASSGFQARLNLLGS
ncbi:putative pantothenate transporter, partial [Aureobasidium melanogenum]